MPLFDPKQFRQPLSLSGSFTGSFTGEFSGSLSGVSASNGITYTNGLIELGGNLNKATFIVTGKQIGRASV